MECLFKTTTKNSLEEYKKFSKAMLRTKTRIIVWILMYVLAILLCILRNSVKFLLFVAIYNFLVEWLYWRRIKKTYLSNKSYQDIDLTVEFYDTYMVQKSDMSEAKIEYSNIHKIIETKTNFYVMISENQGAILVKENFPDAHTHTHTHTHTL